MKIFFTIVFTLAAIVIAGIVYIYSGSYDVSANSAENKLTKWVLRTIRESSIESRIKNITAPNLENPSLIKQGLAHYKEMCEDCHGSPAKSETEISVGLNPPAPNLVKLGSVIPPEEIFWVTKNGIKMTGMPAWGKTHSDDKIWAIVAAVKKLNRISVKEYDSIKFSDEKEDHKH
ncbi:cytochrome c [Melioribacteraceae bacterium 4301-Me]|uniref:c-type cytochrome n=1 Tax=Pyranulibacter aquaticus TaxID=3163344 RepID=UPI003599EBC6